jgi:predicted outer membrane lipoprotein
MVYFLWLLGLAAVCFGVAKLIKEVRKTFL